MDGSAWWTDENGVSLDEYFAGTDPDAWLAEARLSADGRLPQGGGLSRSGTPKHVFGPRGRGKAGRLEKTGGGKP